MNLTYGNVYEIKFSETGPRPPNAFETESVVRVAGTSVGEALQRWEIFRTQYNTYYPMIVSVTQVLEGVYY